MIAPAITASLSKKFNLLKNELDDRSRQLWAAIEVLKTIPKPLNCLIQSIEGNANGNRCRLWIVELETLVDEAGLSISVSHFSPGASKWNKIDPIVGVEHRMFSHITENWIGRPLIVREVVVNLIANTLTRAGLHSRLNWISASTLQVLRSLINI